MISNCAPLSLVHVVVYMFSMLVCQCTAMWTHMKGVAKTSYTYFGALSVGWDSDLSLFLHACMHLYTHILKLLIPSVTSVVIWLDSMLLGCREKRPKEEKKKKKNKREEREEGLFDEDVVQDLILSEDEDESERDTPSPLAKAKEKSLPLKKQSKKQKTSTEFSKNKSHFRSKNSKKRRKANWQGTFTRSYIGHSAAL